jgi:serine/threonine protein kinase
MHACCTACFGDLSGDLLGSGSFGRVFKGRWAGRTVAIKVIEHSSDTIAAVENEIRLMFSFNHQNLVRALHCVTFEDQHSSRNAGAPGSCSASSSKMSKERLQEAQCLAAAGQGADINTTCGIQQQYQPAQAAAIPPPKHDNLQQWEQQQQQQQQNEVSAALNEVSAAKVIPASSIQLETTDSVTVDCGTLGASIARCSTAGTGVGGCSTAGSSSTGYRRAETRLVLEYCNCGTLRSFVGNFWKLEQQQQQDQTEVVTDSVGRCSSDAQCLQLVLLLQGVAQGLEVLHSSGVAHGDLVR